MEICDRDAVAWVARLALRDRIGLIFVAVGDKTRSANLGAAVVIFREKNEQNDN